MSGTEIMRPLLFQSWRAIAAATFSHLVYALLPMQAPIIAGLIVASLSGETATMYEQDWIKSLGDPIVFASALLVLLAIATCAAAYWRSIATATLSRGIVSELRSQSLRAVHGVDNDCRLPLGPVEIQDRIINDTAQVRRYVERVYVQAIVNVVRIGYPVVMLFLINSALAASAIAVLVPQVLLTIWLMRRLADAMRKVRRTRSMLNHKVADFARLRERGDLSPTLNAVQQLEQDEMTSARYTAMNTANVWLFTCLGIATVWWFGAQSVSSGSLGLGELVAFAGTLAFVYQPVRQFAQIANTSRRGMVALERLSELHQVATESQTSIARATDQRDSSGCSEEKQTDAPATIALDRNVV